MRWLVVLPMIALGACAVPATQALEERQREGAPEEGKRYIGQAWMEADGTIRMNLRAEGPSGIVGHSLLEYAPSHPEYDEILKHLGPMKPGETRAVPAWPD